MKNQRNKSKITLMFQKSKLPNNSNWSIVCQSLEVSQQHHNFSTWPARISPTQMLRLRQRNMKSKEVCFPQYQAFLVDNEQKRDLSLRSNTCPTNIFKIFLNQKFQNNKFKAKNFIIPFFPILFYFLFFCSFFKRIVFRPLRRGCLV